MSFKYFSPHVVNYMKIKRKIESKREKIHPAPESLTRSPPQKSPSTTMISQTASLKNKKTISMFPVHAI